MTPVEIDAAADREARRAKRFYARQSPAVAARFHAELWRAIGAISRNPTAFAPHAHGTRFYHLRKFAYHLIYVAGPVVVVVIAVAHDHRRPGYWVRRLPQP